MVTKYASIKYANMMKSLCGIMIVAALSVALLVNAQPTRAGATGSLSTLSFPGASTASCGTWQITGAGITVTGPGVATIFMRDRRDVLLYPNTPFTIAPGTYLSLSDSFSTPVTENPITVRVTIDGVIVFDGSAQNPCRPATQPDGSPSFGAPPTFAQRQIICNTAAFDNPGGNRIADTLLTIGQTWYVAINQQQDATGAPWTAIWIPNQPTVLWVPSVCVQGSTLGSFSYAYPTPIVPVEVRAATSPQVTAVPNTTVIYNGSQRTYVVQAGDNLYRISLRFGVPLATLAAANGIYNYDLIYVGQVLVLP